MTGKEFKKLLKELRVKQKQFALMNGISEQAVGNWIRNDAVPLWASQKLYDWQKYPDLVNDNILGLRNAANK